MIDDLSISILTPKISTINSNNNNNNNHSIKFLKKIDKILLNNIVKQEIKDVESKSKLNDDVCVFCLDNINSEQITIGCKHIFHKKCFMEYTNYNNTCPVCRYNFIEPHYKKFL
jgi:hypothetical protein